MNIANKFRFGKLRDLWRRLRGEPPIKVKVIDIRRLPNTTPREQAGRQGCNAFVCDTIEEQIDTFLRPRGKL